MTNNKTKVITGKDTRLSYFNGWEPKSINGGPEKYSVSVLISKDDVKTIKAIEEAIDAAIEEGVGKFGGKKPNKAAIKLPLRDGDIERDDEAYKGHYFINANGKKYIVWRCCNRVENGPGVCDAEAIREVDLQTIVIKAINKALGKRASMKATLAANIESVVTDVGGISIDEIDIRLEELQKELLKVANSKVSYVEIADEIFKLRELKQSAMVDSAEREGLKLRIDEMNKFLDEQTEVITEYDEQLTRRLIEKITVYENYFTVEFKSGTSVDIYK